MALAAAIRSGEHELQIQSGAELAAAKVGVSAPQPMPPDVPYRGQRVDGGWRIDWLTPGGGPQTTLVLDDAGASH